MLYIDNTHPEPWESFLDEDDRQLADHYDSHMSSLYRVSAYPCPDVMRYVDRTGKEISFGTWSVLASRYLDYKIVKQQYIGDYLISTVWLGINHNIYPGAAVIFETMVFFHGDATKEPSWEDLEMNRYSHEQDAIDGHEELVKLYKEKVGHASN